MQSNLKLTRRQFLAFELAQDFLCLTATDHLLEVTSFSIDQIVPLMNVPDSVMGIASYRSEIIGVIDLPGLLDMPSLCEQYEHQTFQTIVVRHHERIAGFAVNAIGQLLQVNNSELIPTSPKNLPRKFIKCVQSSYHPPKGKDMLVIDITRLFDILEAISNIEL